MTTTAPEAQTQKHYPRSPKHQVPVVQEAIDRAIPKDSSGCVAAEAIKLFLPGMRRVAVDIQTISFTDPERGLRYHYLTPRKVADMIVDFDQGTLPESGWSFRLQNGQVTTAGTRGAKAKKERTPAQQAATERMRAKLAQQKLVARVGNGNVPEVVGGKAPPQVRGRFGKRREFGLRGYQR